jgi:ABC-type multidrug transport system ATPase subunit
MTDPVLSAESIVVALGGHVVLDQLSCVLRRGAITVVSGSNGAGKSTLVRALAALLPLRSGRVLRAAATRPPCVVFDQGGLISGLTVAEMVGLPLIRGRVPAARVADRVAWALARFDLSGMGYFTAERLSRGQAVRMQLARAALLEPDALLCDGPLDQLSETAAEEMGRLLRRAAGAGAAVLITTNVTVRTARLGDEAYVLENGRLARDRFSLDQPET